MAKTVVGLFSTLAEAEKVKQALLSEGLQAKHITVVANDGDTTGSAEDTDEGIGHRIGRFFGNLTGGDDDLHNHYASGLNSGGSLLAVTCPDEQATPIAATLKRLGARDVDAAYIGAAGDGAPGYRGNSAGAKGETVIPVVEEELVVGKREVDRGGVRVYSHVVERPVRADVTLREERIKVERRPASRVATAADFAESGGPIELTASGEEAVVGKSARVVEEVLVGKSSTERTEAIQDSVRRTEVEVEQVPGSTTKRS